ncbi:MAG: adaptor protein MecA [Lachnospiraceae bacterium]|nr:adaptor protein MecA [Lachnospiraceae bacterium]
MKIEKVNDHQIRCTLTRADLADRQLKLSELAYGTEKAKNLFRDMIRQASINFGFEAEDIPLMIEAIPLNSDCIVLIITKVEDPEELDTRFSRFAPSVMDDEDEEGYEYDYSDTEEEASLNHVPDSDNQPLDNSELINLFNRIKQEAANIIGTNPADVSVSVTEIKDNGTVTERTSTDEEPVTKIFAFDSMRELITTAEIVGNMYDDENSLYRDISNGQYVLVLGLKKGNKEAFNKTCNILSEYGKLKRLSSASESYFEEHYEEVIKNNALQTLSRI